MASISRRLLALMALLIPASNASADCRIKFEHNGKDSPWISLPPASGQDANTRWKEDNNIGGPWEFILQTQGRECQFDVYGTDQPDHRSMTYGTGINGRVRVGAKGAHDSGGWQAMAVKLLEILSPQSCSISLGDGGVTQSFTGPAQVYRVSGWDFVRRTEGACDFEVFNEEGYKGRSKMFQGDVRERIRVGWRIRSVRIREIKT